MFVALYTALSQYLSLRRGEFCVNKLRIDELMPLKARMPLMGHGSIRTLRIFSIHKYLLILILPTDIIFKNLNLNFLFFLSDFITKTTLDFWIPISP